MTQANKNILMLTGKWMLLIMLPIFILGWYFNAPFVNGFSDVGCQYLYLLFSAGVAEGIMDTLQFHFSTSKWGALS